MLGFPLVGAPLTEEGFLADARKRHDSLAADLAEVRG